MVTSLLQGILKEADYLDPFRSSCRLGYGMETDLVALTDNLHQGLDSWTSSPLVLLNLLAAFNTIDHGVFLHRLTELGLGGLGACTDQEDTHVLSGGFRFGILAIVFQEDSGIYVVPHV